MDRRAILGFSIGPAGVGLLSAISLPIMTWIFPSDMVGQLSMLQVAIGFCTVLCCLGLDQAYCREYHEASDRAALLLSTTVPGLALLVVALLALVIADSTLLSRLLYGVNSVAQSLVTALCLFAAYFSRFLSVILRMQDRGFAYSFSQMTSRLALLLIVLCYALLTSSRTFIMLLLAQALAWVVTLLEVAWSTRADWCPALHAKLETPRLRHLLAFGLPLTFAGVASWGVAMLDRVFLRSMSTYEELAIYSVAASIATGVNILAGILNTIWTPMIYKWVAEKSDMERVDSIARQTAAIVFLIMCLAGAFSWALAYILPIEYHDAPFLVVACMVGPLLYTLSEVTGIGIAISRRTIFSLIASGAAVIMNVALCLLLVPSWGAVGAAAATACSFWLFFVLRTEFSAAVWRNMPRTKVHFYGLLIVFLALAYGAFGRHAEFETVVGWWIVLVTALYAERSTLAAIWGEVRRYARATEEKECIAP